MLHAFVGLMITFASVGPPPSDPGLELELISSSFSSPLLVTAPDGDDRLFVVEQGGRVRLVRNDAIVGTYLDVGFLLPSPLGSEQGLLGMAFHPSFASNGLLYLSYTDTAGWLVITEVTVDPAADSVGVGSRDTVIRVPSSGSNHNAGMILFGPDGYLYISTGDGGGSGDPNGNGQDPSTLNGAMLRIDVNSDDFPADALRDYGIPADNPYVGGGGAGEVWLYGLRNPWRFWIDPPTGRMYIADVGQSAREEITIVESNAGGSNLGWNRLEGSRCYPNGGSCSTVGTVLPQIEYDHSVGRSVTGGAVYRGNKIPSFQGTYFYADFASGWVRSFDYDGSVSNHYDWGGVFPTSLVSSFGVGGDGEIYVVSITGSVWRIVAAAEPADELFFYRSDGLYRFYNVRPEGSLGAPISAGNDFTTGWTSITALDLDGNGQDEMFFYRSDGTYGFYEVDTLGALGQPILEGTDYTTGWTSITALDLDGDGQDEMMFYRDDGLYRYYDIRPNGTLPPPIRAGDDYTSGWDSITRVDLDGDGQDEMMFYRDDGLYRYYDIRSDGTIPPPIRAGDDYTSGWDSITRVDLDGDGQDEVFFYRNDGLFRYYDIRSDGTIPAPLLAGDGYTSGWDSITAVGLD